MSRLKPEHGAMKQEFQQEGIMMKQKAAGLVRTALLIAADSASESSRKCSEEDVNGLRATAEELRRAACSEPDCDVLEKCRVNALSSKAPLSVTEPLNWAVTLLTGDENDVRKAAEMITGAADLTGALC